MSYVALQLGHCEECGMATTMALYGRDMEACTVCGTARRRTIRQKPAET